MPTPPARPRLRLPVLLSALVGCALLAPVLTTGTGDATYRASRASGATSLKAPIHGLVDRIGAPDPGTGDYISGYVVRVSWADLQPTPYGPIVTDNAIDQAIARVRQPDMAGRMTLKLRVLAGIYAPDWAKQIGGAPLPYLNNQAGSRIVGGTIGRFWLPAYGAAYADLQHKLAHRYDVVPEIREITVDGCSTIYDELFVRQAGVPQNSATLAAAGYTTAADQVCIQQAIVAHRVWRLTTSDVDFSPLPNMLGTGQDLTFTLSAMDFCRAQLGPRCGLENNALSSAKLVAPKFVTMYQRMAELGGALTFQTATSSRIGDWTAALDAAVSMHALSVELPYGYQDWPADELTAYDRKLGS